LVASGRRGFTLIEAIIALLLSSVVIILVSGTFLAQSQYYSAQTLNVGVHDNARVATDRLASELRSTMEDGFVVAGPRTMTIRTPIRLAAVCETGTSRWTVYFEDGESGIDVNEVAGVALRDQATGTWEYQNATWSALDGGSNDAALDCAASGPADTTGATGHFNRLQLASRFASTPVRGDILMLFRETTFKIQPSVLDTRTLGLYRQEYGGSLVEFATGMDSTAQFQYRTGGTTYADTIIGSGVANIDAVRIVADARLPSRSGLQEDATFGWSVNVALRNLP
jgi:prepilin-type N-terminal cleavage/methylation domain-containing protein